MPKDDIDSWKLVHFIRHLPKITEEEIEQMESLNPVSPRELKERLEESEFLEGESDSGSSGRRALPKTRKP